MRDDGGRLVWVLHASPIYKLKLSKKPAKDVQFSTVEPENNCVSHTDVTISLCISTIIDNDYYSL